ncbi:MAG: acylneuraminate cytidylyltransferase family protein [Defluviitaleaceae bacterium]|nr:acylneuraminate cytidylyltransferase family protein [Defluviitaleaceae bacterium]
MKSVALIPIKLNNERLPGKNLKPFDNGEPLINYTLKTALQVQQFDEIYVYCSQESIVDFLPNGVKFLKRPESLDLPTASIADLMRTFAENVNADIYVKMHVTAPFISTSTLQNGLNAVSTGNFDSAFAVKFHQDFLWIDDKPQNYDGYNIIRTQDLQPFYTETTGLYIFNKNLAKQGRRIGNRPFLLEVSSIEAIDINDTQDFEIANAIFNHIIKKGQP